MDRPNRTDHHVDDDPRSLASSYSTRHDKGLPLTVTPRQPSHVRGHHRVLRYSEAEFCEVFSDARCDDSLFMDMEFDAVSIQHHVETRRRRRRNE